MKCSEFSHTEYVARATGRQTGKRIITAAAIILISGTSLLLWNSSNKPVYAGTDPASEIQMAPASGIPQTEISADDYPSILVNGITKEQCEYILGQMPESLHESADASAVKNLVEFINTGYDMLEPGAPHGQDLPLSTYNKYISLVTDLELTSENAGEYMHGGSLYEQNGDYYIPWYQIDAWPQAEAEITDTVVTDDEIRVIYNYRKLIPSDDSTVIAADPIELCAILTQRGEDGKYRVTEIGTQETGEPASGQETENKAASQQNQDFSTSNQDAVADSYKAVYREVVKTYTENLSDDSTMMPLFDLYYIDDDQVPELAVYAQGEYGYRYYYIYTIRNGEPVLSLSQREGPFMLVYIPGCNVIPQYDGPSAQGMIYVMKSFINDEGLLVLDEHQYYSGPVGSENEKYYIDDKEVTEDEYISEVGTENAEPISPSLSGEEILAELK